MHGIEGAAVVPEAEDQAGILVQQADGEIVMLLVHGEAMLDGIGGHLLDAQGDVVADLLVMPVADAEAFRLVGGFRHLVHGMDLHLQQVFRRDAEVLLQQQGRIALPGNLPGHDSDQDAEEEEGEPLAGGEIEPGAGDPHEAAEEEGRGGGEEGALDHGDRLRQPDPPRPEPGVLQGVGDRAGDHARGEHTQAENGHLLRRVFPRDEEGDQERRGEDQESPHAQAEHRRVADQEPDEGMEGGAVLLVMEDARERQGDAADPGGDRVGGVAYGQHRREGGDGVTAAGGLQDPVHGQHEEHGGGHIEAGREPFAEELEDLLQGNVLQGEFEDAALRQEIRAGDNQGGVVAEGGGQAHAEHLTHAEEPVREDQDVQQIQGDVRDRHAQHADDQQVALAGHLQEGHEDERTHGAGSADREAGQVAFGHIEETALRAGAHGRGEGAGEDQDDRGEQEGDRAADRYRGGIARIGLTVGAGSQRPAASYLHAGGEQGSDRADAQQERIGQLVGGHGLVSQETADDHDIDKQAQGDRQGGKDLRREHLPDQFSDHRCLLRSFRG